MSHLSLDINHCHMNMPACLYLFVDWRRTVELDSVLTPITWYTRKEIESSNCRFLIKIQQIHKRFDSFHRFRLHEHSFILNAHIKTSSSKTRGKNVPIKIITCVYWYILYIHTVRSMRKASFILHHPLQISVGYIHYCILRD